MSHPKTEAVAELLAAGLTNTAIGRQLHMERQTVGQIRHELGIPQVPAQPLTVEEKWRARTCPVDGGHLEWTGERATESGTPVMRHSGETYTAARIAFRIDHGTDPAGYAKPGCGYLGCVAPAHQDDTGQNRPARQHRARYASPEAKLAALTEPTSDGHLRWTGPTDGPHPFLKHNGRRWPVLTLAFRARYGREPVGTVRAGCDYPGCLLGDHLDDTQARRAHRAAYAAIGL